MKFPLSQTLTLFHFKLVMLNVSVLYHTHFLSILLSISTQNFTCVAPTFQYLQSSNRKPCTHFAGTPYYSLTFYRSISTTKVVLLLLSPQKFAVCRPLCFIIYVKKL